MGVTAKRRFDPERRSRIIDSTLIVIAAHGVSGTTHRRVAEAADVPLGSMTYHFADLEELLTEAFTRLAGKASQRFLVLLEAAETRDQAQEAVVEIIVGMSACDLLLSYELYAYAARHPGVTAVMRDWMRKSRIALERHFEPSTARAIDAFIEGMTIHQSVDPHPEGRDGIARIIGSLVRYSQSRS